jgi:large subunit ribosomal protein L24
MANFKIKRDDTVMVIAGKSKGRTGKVLKVMPAKGRILVEGVNVIKRHVKAQGETPGSIVEKEASLHISNVALWNAEDKRRVKAAWRFVDVDGKRQKVRIDKSTQARID